jgi:excisionase family DNA binding protein
MKIMNDKELLTINEMAARLKVKPSWLYFRTMQTDSDAIPRIRIGKYIRFNPDAVMEWIQKQYGEANK